MINTRLYRIYLFNSKASFYHIKLNEINVFGLPHSLACMTRFSWELLRVYKDVFRLTRMPQAKEKRPCQNGWANAISGPSETGFSPGPIYDQTAPDAMIKIPKLLRNSAHVNWNIKLISKNLGLYWSRNKGFIKERKTILNCPLREGDACDLIWSNMVWDISENQMNRCKIYGELLC